LRNRAEDKAASHLRLDSSDPTRAGRAIGIALIILTSSSKQFRLR
jgi:hypothetical protein